MMIKEGQICRLPGDRTEKLGLVSLVVAIIGTAATVAVVPEVRERFAASPAMTNAGTLASMIFAQSDTSHPLIDQDQLRHLCDRRLRSTDLTGMTQKQLELLRNGIYAIHGRPFKRADLRTFFASQSWYRSDPSYEDGRLTAVDVYNVEVILKVERARRVNGGA